MVYGPALHGRVGHDVLVAHIVQAGHRVERSPVVLIAEECHRLRLRFFSRFLPIIPSNVTRYTNHNDIQGVISRRFYS